MLTPYAGDEGKNAVKDSFNFHLSQCRIRIEMTFGRLTNKWRIFRRPLSTKLKNVGLLFLCATRLHNYCLNERLLMLEEQGRQDEDAVAHPDADFEDDIDNTPLQQQYIHSALPTAAEQEAMRGYSMMRDSIVRYVRVNNIRRPVYNQQRNRDIHAI